MNPALRRSAAHAFVDSLEAPVLAPEDLHHLVRVLRVRDGEVVSTSDGAGRWRLCRLVAGGELHPDSEIIDEPAPVPAIAIGFAIPKGERPEWIVQKLTEIGADRIILLESAHSVVRWDPSKAARNVERLDKIARQAAMQSRRVRLVEIVGPMPVMDLAGRGGATVGNGGGVALAEPGGAPPDLANPTVLIGPEGGWTDQELAGFSATVSLGPTILRVETAAIVAGTLLVAGR